MYRSSSCTSVINSNDGSRCKNFICKTRVQLRTHACLDRVACTRDTGTGRQLMQQTDTGMQVYTTAMGKEILLITQASGFHIRWEDPSRIDTRFLVPASFSTARFPKAFHHDDEHDANLLLESSPRYE